MSTAAERGRGRLHVHFAARAQTHAHRPVEILEQRCGFDAFDRAQMLHDLLGILTVGVARLQHGFVDDGPAIAAVFFQPGRGHRVRHELGRREALVGEDPFGDQRLVGSAFHHLGRNAQHVGGRVRMHERARVGHDGRQDAGRDVGGHRNVHRFENAQYARSGRRFGLENIVEEAEFRVAEVVVDVEHVLARDFGQIFARPRKVAHVAEHPQRIGRQIRRHVPRDELGIGQKAQVARHGVLLKIADAFAERFQRETEGEARPERIAVGFHVRDEHERRAPLQFGYNFFRRRRRRFNQTTHRSPSHALTSSTTRSPLRSTGPRRT